MQSLSIYREHVLHEVAWLPQPSLENIEIRFYRDQRSICNQTGREFLMVWPESDPGHCRGLAVCMPLCFDEGPRSSSTTRLYS